MKTLAFAALFVGATGLIACGGGDDDSGPMFVDSGMGPMTCNPVTQQGCAEGEKCSWIVAQVMPTFLGQTACVRDGNVELGGTCTDNCIEKGSTEIGPECDAEGGVVPDSTKTPPIIGTDNCAAGGVCINSICTQVCQGADACGAEAACVGYGDLFTDSEGVGACSPTCDPLVQDCGEGKGCYVDPSPGAGFATCEAELAPDRGQNAECPMGACSLNGCAAGFGPWLSDADGKILCTRITRTGESYLIDPEGVGADPEEGTPPELAPSALPWGGMVETYEMSCIEDAVGDAQGLNSFFLKEFYGDTQDTPAEWGICAQVGVLNFDAWTFGNCEKFSVEHYFATYNAAAEGEEEAALDELCSTTEKCGFSCLTDEKFEELSTAYCEGEFGMGTKACEPAEARSRIRRIVLGTDQKKDLPVLKRTRLHNW